MAVHSVFHVGFVVRDLDASIRFYTEGLGLRFRLQQTQDNDYTRALVGAGYQNYTIFRLRTTVVGYAECVPDVATVLDRMANHPVSSRWADALAGVAKHQLELADPVWRL